MFIREPLTDCFEWDKNNEMRNYNFSENDLPVLLSFKFDICSNNCP